MIRRSFGATCTLLLLTAACERTPDLKQVLNYLEGMTLVRGVALEQVAGEKMRFRLAVRGDAATLRRAIALDHRLVPLDAPVGSSDAGDRLAFRYQP